MEGKEFERLLHIGMGRAILFAQTHDLTPYHDSILYACLHNTAYDPQVEGSRARYMLDLIHLTVKEPFYREQILAALARSVPSDDWDQHQLFNFARLFAQNGAAAARQLLYDAFVKNAAANDSTGAADIVELDGIEGLLFVIDRIGAQLLTEGDIYEADYLLDIANERAGEERTLAALNTAAATNPGIAAYIQRIAKNKLRRTKAAQERKDAPQLTYDQIKSMIIEKRDKVPRMWLSRCGKSASDEELVRAAADLLLEDDRLRLLAYLRIFKKRRFPLEPGKLIALALDADDTLCWWACAALDHIAHPDVRVLAESLLERGQQSAGAVGLLLNNYREGDYALIETAIKAEQDEDEIHAIGGKLLNIVDAHPSRAAANSLIAMYEQGACSECRADFVDCLLALDALPDWIRDEYRHDANHNLRGKLALSAS